jgi:DNA-binding NarL/FixJ family response regulator
MCTEDVKQRLVEGIEGIRTAEQHISDALVRFARRGSGQDLRSAVVMLLDTTREHVERLELLAEEMGDLMQAPTRIADPPSNYSRLTSREAQILPMIGEGYANKQIAAQLNISIKTVEKHRQHLMDKLGLHDIAGVTRYAISAGVVAARA